MGAAIEPKPMASLSSTLLARKGQAKPAMRPQGFASFGYGAPQPHDDLGWNDMGFDPAQFVPQPSLHQPVAQQPLPPTAEIVSIIAPMAPELHVEPPVVVQQLEALERELTVPAPVLLPAVVIEATAEVVEPVLAVVRAAPGTKAKAAFTLRLDPDRHLRLRLACAVAHRSAQALVVEALDAFLQSQPGVTDMARTAAAHNDR